jgi:uncharacterized membrane protein
MLAFRASHYDSPRYMFLAWNLILAGIPFAISQWLALFPPRTNLAFIAFACFWLLFFPNAPYIMTDLMHLREHPPVPLWFDLILLLSFAWNGLMLGFLSLLEMQGQTDIRFGRIAGWLLVAAASVLGAFGIYLGRYLRWNSWDAITQPAALLSDIAAHIADPIEFTRMAGVTLGFALFLLLGYLLLKSLVRVESYRAAADARWRERSAGIR